MTRKTRLSWDRYFIHIAHEIAQRSTCNRAIVGCVIVKDKRILSAGYNGSLPGEDHCDETDHLMEDGHCVRTVHGEANAVAQAARFGISLEGATSYCTVSPCWICFKLLVSAGIKHICFETWYRRDEKMIEHAKRQGILLTEIPPFEPELEAPGDIIERVADEGAFKDDRELRVSVEEASSGNPDEFNVKVLGGNGSVLEGYENLRMTNSLLELIALLGMVNLDVLKKECASHLLIKEAMTELAKQYEEFRIILEFEDSDDDEGIIRALGQRMRTSLR